MGIDHISKKQYGEKLEENLADLVSRIHLGTYRPQPKREVLIPKPNGDKRPLAIGCFEDKLVEWVVAKILENIYEPSFIRNSFGFRPSKSAHQAIEACYCSLKDNQRPHVVEIDFSKFFNTIPHRKMMKILGKRIADNRFKGLIGRLLKVAIQEQNGTLQPIELGTPQGSIASPVLANIYLNEVLDHWFLENFASYNNIIVRYADDAVFFFKCKQEAENFLQRLHERVTGYGLSLNEDKTCIVDFRNTKNDHFDFLGFTFYWGKTRRHKRQLAIKTQKKQLHRKLQEFDQWMKEVRNQKKTSDIWKMAQSKLSGHYLYFGYWMN